MTSNNQADAKRPHSVKESKNDAGQGLYAGDDECAVCLEKSKLLGC